MQCRAIRLGLSLAAFVLFNSQVAAQINWTMTYADGEIGAGGLGFADPTVVNSTTLGQLRRDSITAAVGYLNTVLDGRGTVKLQFALSDNDTSLGYLAYNGPNQVSGDAGSFQNGGVYQAARTNVRPFPFSQGGDPRPDASGGFNFGYSWNYAGKFTSSSSFDMVTVAIHEIAHGAGFLSFTDSSGRGNNGNPLGTPDVYSGFDRYLQRGNGTGGNLFNTNINSSNFGTFTGPIDTLTNGNNNTTGLFFGGQYTREVLSGPSKVYAPFPYQPGSSNSHVADSLAVMNPSVTPDTVKRFLNYEVAMMMDIGWNVYNWSSGDGNWKDGVTGTAPNEVYSLTDTKWRTDQGIVYSGADNGDIGYNTFANPGQAPVLPPYGQVTSNIVLNFGGSGTTAYTSQNNLGNIRLSRLNLNSTAGVTNTITNSTDNPTGTLIFGVNSDGTSSVLSPKIVQQNSGAFRIDINIQTTNTGGNSGGPWPGLTLDSSVPIGVTPGRVTLGGVISGNGALLKTGSFTAEITGPAANTYTGLTNVINGILVLNKTPGQNAFAGNLIVTGGTAQLGASDQMPESGTVTLAGGTISTGETLGFSDTVGKLEILGNSSIALGSGSHTLTFSGFNDNTLAGILTVTGWTGSQGTAGEAGRILVSGVVGDPNTTFSTFLQNVKFTGYPSAIFIPTGTSGTWELVPVPEPMSVLAIAGGALGLGGAFVRRLRRKPLESCPPTAIIP